MYMDKVWFVVVSVSVMFSTVVPIFLLIVVRPIHVVLEMFGSLLLSSILHGRVLLILFLLCPSEFQLVL